MLHRHSLVKVYHVSLKVQVLGSVCVLGKTSPCVVIKIALHRGQWVQPFEILK